MIQHDENGPFVRSGRATEPQTEKVYGVEVRYHDGSVEHWDIATVEPTRASIDRILRVTVRNDKRIVSARAVVRAVTITATPWSYTPERLDSADGNR